MPRSRPTAYFTGPGSVPSAGAALRTMSLMATVLLWAACGGHSGKAHTKAPGQPEICGIDETREFFCDDLVPSGGVPAPAPYEACPWTIDYATGEYDPPPAVSVFDSRYTEYLRKRAPPGHACCYSWCSKLAVKPATAASDQSSCQTPTAFHEEYCVREPEAGTSEPSGSEFRACPAALSPPSRSVFSAPKAAVFDSQSTIARRNRNESMCCYAWCSQAPPGSGLERRGAQPNSR